jgi:hypothetical protein
MQLAQGAISRILNGETTGPFRLQVIGKIQSSLTHATVGTACLAFAF